MHRIIIAGFLCLLSGAAATQDFRAEITAVTPLNFDAGGAPSRQFYLNAGAYRFHDTVHRTRKPRPLSLAPRAEVAAAPVRWQDGEATLTAYVDSDPLLDGVIVLHRGAVVFEAYPHMQPWQRHFAWSVTKVFAAATLAALAADDRVDMQAPVERYLPALEATAWAGTKLQAIADMASGIDCRNSDGYQNKSTCIYRMEEALGITAPTGRQLDFMKELRAMRRHRPAGTRSEYVSANTEVLGLVVEAVTGESFASASRKLVWDHIGPEADALLTISKDGYAYASGGLSLRLRDLARFGEVFTRPGAFGVIDASLLTLMQTEGLELPAEERDALTGLFGKDLPLRSAWQWDYGWRDGALFKGGYDGQGLYVDPARELVIAWFGTGRHYGEMVNGMLPVARQLATSGLFAGAP